jgi:hypothetical protein
MKAQSLRLGGAFGPFAEIPLAAEPLVDPISFGS